MSSWMRARPGAARARCGCGRRTRSAHPAGRRLEACCTGGAAPPLAPPSPRQLFKPTYNAYADKCAEDKLPVVFTYVLGDKNGATAAIMKKYGVKSVPSFHVFKGGEQVLHFTGANKANFASKLASVLDGAPSIGVE